MSGSRAKSTLLSLKSRERLLTSAHLVAGAARRAWLGGRRVADAAVQDAIDDRIGEFVDEEIGAEVS